MNKLAAGLARLLWVAVLAQGGLARAQDDAGALSLESAPQAEPKQQDKAFRAFVEAAAGGLDQRYGLPTDTARRLSLDLNWTARPAAGWRTVFSDRLDSIQPPGDGNPPTLNSLREAYVGHQDEGGQTVVEFGRINVRNGPAYGYNPTDFFRDGALRAYTTADPLALRLNRMGTVMLRGERIWNGGTAAVALAPKLANGPSDGSFDLDLGATNDRDRVLLTASAQPSDKVSGQLLAFSAAGLGQQLGASMTALLTDAAVGHLEWAGGRQAIPFDPTSTSVWRNRLSSGITYSAVAHLSLTAEVEYNGAALDRSAWNALSADALASYLTDAQRRQDNAARLTYMLYATQTGGLVKNLDFTGLLRVNADDHSRFGWLEMRYHWPSIDLALQWQRSSGAQTTEYGASTTRQLTQLMLAWYF